MAKLPPPSLPADYFINIHKFTKTVHRDQYPSIDPTSPSLSQKGKTVIIIGASQGIGKAIAIAFAKAGAQRIVIASRSAEKLEVTKTTLLEINGDVDILAIPTDISSDQSVAQMEKIVKEKFGVPDVLVNAAGLWSSTEVLGETDPQEWWADFEINLKGAYLTTRSFLRLVGSDRPGTIVNVSTWGMLMTGAVGTSYAISKLALTRLTEAVPAAYPKVTAICYHPGMIKTEMADQHPEVLPFCEDTVELAAGVAVYLSCERAKFLSGRYMSANWDVDELEEKKDEILSGRLLKLDLRGEFGV